MMSTHLSIKKGFIISSIFFLIFLWTASYVSAATSQYQFLDENGNYSAHASSFITEDASISGNIATITLENSTVIGDLLVHDGSSYVLANRTVDSNGNVQFTFQVSDFDIELPVQLFVNAGPHGGYISLYIEWL